jgi:isopentenyldiphosphate isomerase
LVDEKNQVQSGDAGKVLRKDMRAKNLWHRSSYIFIETADGKFLVQKRVDTKEYCPGYYALATGGVMGPDETNELNAQRELAEEVGVVRKAEDMKLLEQFKYSDKHTSCWGNVFYVKLTDKDVVKIQEEEVADVEYWTRDQVEALIKT